VEVDKAVRDQKQDGFLGDIPLRWHTLFYRNLGHTQVPQQGRSA
jgi:hypothetical protein